MIYEDSDLDDEIYPFEPMKFNLNPKKWYYIPAVLVWMIFLFTVCVLIIRGLWWYSCLIWNLF